MNLCSINKSIIRRSLNLKLSSHHSDFCRPGNYNLTDKFLGGTNSPKCGFPKGVHLLLASLEFDWKNKSDFNLILEHVSDLN